MQRNRKEKTHVAGRRPLAPTQKRIEPGNWLLKSTLAGVLLGATVLKLLWSTGPDAPGIPLEELAREPLRWLLHRSEIGARLFSMRLSVRFEELPEAIRTAIYWRATASVVAGLIPGGLMWSKHMTPRDRLVRLRGSQRFVGAAAITRLRADLGDRVKRRPDHDLAPKVPYPADLWTRHMLVVGGVGSGKSTAIKPLLEKVISAGEQALIFDPKGEFTEGFDGPQIIAPWDTRSLAWDIAEDLRNLLDMRRFAASMIQSSQDPMWANASRQLLVGLLVHLTRTRGKAWGWRELAEHVALPQAELVEIMRACHPEAIRAVEKASVTTAGILINLSSFCSPILDLALAWGEVPKERRVSFVAWVRGTDPLPRPQIILQGHGAYAELTKAYVGGIVGTIAALVNSVEMPESLTRKIWFIADELPQMGKIPLRALFEVGRSRGVRCVVACQDLAQLEEIHGKEWVKALVAMSGSLLIGQTQQGDTAEALCKAFGTVEVERPSTTGEKATTSFTREEMPLYKASELASRLGLSRDSKSVVMLLFMGGNAYELRYPIYRMKQVRPRIELAAWATQFEGGQAFTPGPKEIGTSDDASSGSDIDTSLLDLFDTFDEDDGDSSDR